LCFPGKEVVAVAVAKITGKTAGAVEELVAVVHCAKNQGDVQQKYHYVGHGTCAGATLAFEGPLDCQYGCIGFGDCANACQFGAITMVNGIPMIDPSKCVACGNCVDACPKGIIKLVPKKARVIIRCSTKDTAKATMAVCQVGCIHNKLCIKKCPAHAISEVDGVVTIDHEKCMDYGPDCDEVCVSACKKRHILQRFRLSVTEKKITERAA
jgi:electron transport complex protein RnfB